MTKIEPEFQSEDPKDARMYEIEHIAIKTASMMIKQTEDIFTKHLDNFKKENKKIYDLLEQNAPITETSKRTWYLVPLLAFWAFGGLVTLVVILFSKHILP